MYRKPAVKKQKQHANDYTIYSKNTDISKFLKKKETYTISIDPAQNYYSIQIIRRDDSETEICTLSVTNLGKNKKDYHDPYFTNLIELLDEHEDWWEHINLVLVEECNIGEKTNIVCITIQHHTIAYFLTRCPNAIVACISSKVRLRALGCPTNLNRIGQKAWSVEEYQKILKKRGDDRSVRLFMSAKGKKDDMADTGMQEEAFRKLVNEIFLED